MAFTYSESAGLCAGIVLMPAPVATPVVALILISIIYDWVVGWMKGAADGMPAEVRRSDAGVEELALPVGGSDVLQRDIGADLAADDNWELNVAEAGFFPGEEGTTAKREEPFSGDSDGGEGRAVSRDSWPLLRPVHGQGVHDNQPAGPHSSTIRLPDGQDATPSRWRGPCL